MAGWWRNFFNCGGDGHGEWGYCFLDGRKFRLGGCVVGDVVGEICFRT